MTAPEKSVRGRRAGAAATGLTYALSGLITVDRSEATIVVRFSRNKSAHVPHIRISITATAAAGRVLDVTIPTSGANEGETARRRHRRAHVVMSSAGNA